MTDRATAVLAEALRLVDEDRGELAARLLDSLDAGSDPDAAAAWADEILARLEDVRAGRGTPVPWADARSTILSDDDGDAG